MSLGVVTQGLELCSGGIDVCCHRLPHAGLVKWYNSCLVSINRGFDSPNRHHAPFVKWQDDRFVIGRWEFDSLMEHQDQEVTSEEREYGLEEVWAPR